MQAIREDPARAVGTKFVSFMDAVSISATDAPFITALKNSANAIPQMKGGNISPPSVDILFSSLNGQPIQLSNKIFDDDGSPTIVPSGMQKPVNE